MTKALLSIITITKNNQTGLTKTAHSLNDQTYKDYEWIVVNGNSGDQIPHFVTSKNITLINERDNGIYDAMNKGVKGAIGQYFIFMNAGDIFESKNTLTEIHDRIKDEAFDFIYGDSLEDIQGHKHYKRSSSTKYGSRNRQFE